VVAVDMVLSPDELLVTTSCQRAGGYMIQITLPL